MNNVSKSSVQKLEMKPYFANYIENLLGKNIIFNVLKITLNQVIVVR